MNRKPDPAHLSVRTLKAFEFDGVPYSQGAVVVVPVRLAWSWKQSGAVEILGPAEPPVPGVARELDRKPKRKELTGLEVDELLNQVETPTVRVKFIQDCRLNDGARFHEGREYELAKEMARIPLISGHCVIVGPGAQPEPSAEQRIADLESELAKLREQQAHTQTAMQNVDLIIHPTGNDKIRKRKRRDRREL